MKAADIMTRKLKTITPSVPVREVAAFFVKERISGAPVVDAEGHFLGIVTEEDLIFQDKKIHLPTFLNIFSNIIPLGIEHLGEEIRKIAATQAREVMQQKPVSISPGTSVEEIATLMTERKAHYLPVLNKGQIMGVVTKRDLIRAVAKGKVW